MVFGNRERVGSRSSVGWVRLGAGCFRLFCLLAAYTQVPTQVRDKQATWGVGERVKRWCFSGGRVGHRVCGPGTKWASWAGGWGVLVGKGAGSVLVGAVFGGGDSVL